MAKRNSVEMANDRRLIADYYLAGKTQVEIAYLMGLSQATVSRDLKAIQKIWMKQTSMNIEIARATELARLDKLENEYWKAWEKSTKLTPIKLKDNAGVERTLYRPSNDGAPFGKVQYLSGVQHCIRQRRRLLGLDAPQKIHVEMRWELEIIEAIRTGKIDFFRLSDELGDREEAIRLFQSANVNIPPRDEILEVMPDDVEALLKARYANGEISKQQLKNVLGDTPVFHRLTQVQ